MSGGGLGDLVLLLVDDEIEQVAPIVSIAERCGWDVFCATSTAQARERLCGGHVASVFVDLVLLPHVDLFFWRTVPALIGVTLFIYGLIWESH